jgi:acyl-CoA thioesterase II
MPGRPPVGDLTVDAAVERTGVNSYRAHLSPHWEIWGPNGGYLCAIALRAAAAATGRARPANASAHFLGVGAVDQPVDVIVHTQRQTRQATSVHVSISQHDKPLLAAMVWALDAGIDGPEHDDGAPPAAPPWQQVPTVQERYADDPKAHRNPHRFWDNFEQRPVAWLTSDEWAERAPQPAEYLSWLRFAVPCTPSPWAMAERLLLLVDLGGWPSIGRRHIDGTWMAPSIDVSCDFHHVDTQDEWLLLHGSSNVAADGLIATQQSVWNDHGRLLASGRSQLLSRRVPTPAS